jgi:predicted RNA binding protein YcfA (HicA-like mRNA interferase family)
VTKLVLADSSRMEKLLLKLGFEKAREKGSHVFYRHPDGRFTTVPHHKGRMLARPLSREILQEIKIGVEEYNRRLQEL